MKLLNFWPIQSEQQLPQQNQTGERYQIRFAATRDVDSIIALTVSHASYEKAPLNETPEQLESRKQALKQSLFADNPPLYCLIVECENEIVGYATYMKQYST